MTTRMPRTKCGLYPTILQFPTDVARILLQALEEPTIPAAKVAAAIRVQGRYQVSVSDRMVENHRIRGDACPCRRWFRQADGG